MTSEEVPWLTPDEEQTWLSLIHVAVRLPTVLDQQLQRDAGLSHFDYAVLATLSRPADRTLRMSDVASTANVTLSHLSRVAARLEKQGLLTRAPDPDNGRCTLATLTEAGQRKLADSAPGHVQAVRRAVFDVLTPTQAQQLHSLCDALLQNLPDRR